LTELVSSEQPHLGS